MGRFMLGKRRLGALDRPSFAKASEGILLGARGLWDLPCVARSANERPALLRQGFGGHPAWRERTVGLALRSAKRECPFGDIGDESFRRHG
jgi:hypothetical protein